MAETITKKHPIRGAIWGFVLGLGILGFLLVGYPIIGIGDAASFAIQVALIIGGAMLAGVLWAMFGPAKKPKGPPPNAQTTTRSVEPPAAEPAPTSEQAMGDEADESDADPFAST